MNKVIISKGTKIKISLIGGTLVFFLFVAYFRFTNIDFLYKLAFNTRGRIVSKIIAMYGLVFIAGVMGIMMLIDKFVCGVIKSNKCFTEKN